MESYSNFRFLGIGKPTAKQTAKKDARKARKAGATDPAVDPTPLTDPTPPSTDPTTDPTTGASTGLVGKFKALSMPKKIAIIAVPFIALGAIVYLIRRKK